MHLENIHEGDVFKNYKELCAALGTEPKTGCSKMAHINQLGTFCQFHKSGREFCIDKIYDKALAPTANTQRNNSATTFSFNVYIQPVLFHLLYSNDGQICMSKTELYKNLGLIRNTLYTDDIEKNFLNNPLIEPLLLNELKRRLYAKLRSIVSYSLQTLEEKNVLTQRSVITITDTKGNKHIATQQEELIINAINHKVLNEINCKTIEQVFFNNESYTYYSKIREALNEHGWSSFKNEILITLTEKYKVQPLGEKELKRVKQKLNLNLRKFIMHQVMTDYNDSRKFVLTRSITRKSFQDPQYSFGLLSKDDFKSVLSDFCQKFVYYPS